MSANEPGQPMPTEPPTGPFTRDLDPPAVALAIGAHPDDVEFGCGATLAKWAAKGSIVHHVVLTDGSRHVDVDPERAYAHAVLAIL